MALHHVYMLESTWLQCFGHGILVTHIYTSELGHSFVQVIVCGLLGHKLPHMTQIWLVFNMARNSTWIEFRPRRSWIPHYELRLKTSSITQQQDWCFHQGLYLHHDLCPVDSCLNLLSALDSRNRVMGMRTSPHVRALLITITYVDKSSRYPALQQCLMHTRAQTTINATQFYISESCKPLAVR